MADSLSELPISRIGGDEIGLPSQVDGAASTQPALEAQASRTWLLTRRPAGSGRI